MAAFGQQVMIEVSVEPTHLVAGRRTPLAITFRNTGRRACSDVVFKLALPSAIKLMAGANRAEIQVIQPGQAKTHHVAVQPTRPGQFELTSENFAYRDEFDVPVRITDLRISLSVAPPPPDVPEPPPARLNVKHAGGEIALAEWDALRILVRNTTVTPLSNVTVEISGPFRGDSRARVALLSSGATARFSFTVIAAEAGRHVPVSVRTTYSLPDGTASGRSRTQDDRLEVVVASTSESSVSADAAKQTILYVAASPRDMEPLGSVLEMRRVDARLQASRDRLRFEIKPCVAAQLTDVSLALARLKPQIVHFSAHGDEDGNLILEDESGNSVLISPEGLADLLGLQKAATRCVIVNSCHSLRLATAMAQHVEYVVGMRSEIGDDTAIEFSVGFYLGLFEGDSVPQAFKRGCAHIRAIPTSEREHLTPLLLERSANEVRLVEY
jgi:hypothetical protein